MEMGAATVIEFEDKILRAWIEQFIEKYNKNVQSSTEITNIQRIAKKSRARTSTKPVPEHRNIAPLPIYPFFFNPYYHQTIYSKYIPLTYGTPPHLVPVSQVPSSQDEYHHHFLIPLHAQYPYTHIPSFISSTPIVDFSKIKNSINSITNKPPNNQNTFSIYDKPQEIPAAIDNTNNISNQKPDGFNHIPPKIEHHFEDHLKEKPNPIRDGKLLDGNKDNLDLIPTTVPTITTYQFNESQKVQNLPLSTTGDKHIDSSTSSDINSNPETDHVTLTSMSTTLSDISNPLKIISSSVPQLPFDDKLTTIAQFSSPTTEQSETTTSNNISDENSTIDDSTYSSELPENQQNARSSNNKETTTGIPKTFNETEEKTTVIINKKLTTNIETASLPSDITSYPTTTLFSMLQIENNNSQTPKFPSIISPNITTTLHDDLHYSPIQMRSIFSTTQSTNVNIVSDNQSELITPSIHLPLISTTISETTTVPFITAQSSTIMIPSSSPLPEKFNSDQTSSHPIITFDENNNTKLSNTDYTSMFSTLRPLNTTNSRLEDKTENNLSTVVNRSIKSTTQNINISTLNNKLVTSPPTTLITISSTKRLGPRVISPKPHIENSQKNIPSDIKMSSKIYSETKSSTEKSMNTYKIKKTFNYIPSTTDKPKETSSKSLIMAIKPNNSTQKKFTDDSKHKTTTNSPDSDITEPTETNRDSELWYNHLNIQNPHKEKLNKDQVGFLIKKLIKLLKPEIDNQPITKESLAGVITPKLGDQEKLVYIIVPWGRDTIENIENQKQQENNMGT
ncbi:Hypothetical protein CINCED_3A021258 [Cinara cedri]|uniref:Uncharacterized protein n=1 Tax=Cinara cedri TaxID=506608 RepID=A0A5E4NL52_9HEMI|nr:Hypothetical protein CINCED_3A021258 [Cinara cedri]